MKVVILAGGFGTRLSEETSIIPKPMIEIGGRPLLWHLMQFFSHYGLSEFAVALGYKGQVIKNYFLQYPLLNSDLEIDFASGKTSTTSDFPENWKLNLVDTGADSMTGGRLLRLKDLLNDTFVFTYGDGLANVEMNKLLDFHRAHGKLATVTAVSPKPRFGLMTMDEDSRVRGFAEKPDYANELINGGFFVLEPGVLDYINDDQTVWEREPCEQLAADGQLMAYRHDGFWQCVDTLHELRLLRNQWDSGEALWKVW